MSHPDPSPARRRLAAAPSTDLGVRSAVAAGILVAGSVLVTGGGDAWGRTTAEIAPVSALESSGDPRARGGFVSGSTVLGRAPGDTLDFGYVDGSGFAVLGEVWTFDHGGPDPLEGFTGIDVTNQSNTWGRHLTSAAWEADPLNDVPAPVLRGNGSAYIGAFASEARALCWAGGSGYGNDWCQEFRSPVLSRGATSDVDFSWVHFNDTEEDYDYVTCYVERVSDGERFEILQYTGTIGLAGNHPVDPPVGVTETFTLSAADFLGTTEFRLVFEMTSDNAWSDEDDLYPTDYGPMGLDDVIVTEVGGGVLGQFGFETDLEGWTATACPGFGTFLGVAARSDYLIEDPCGCELAGNVLEMHDPNGEHPYGQHAMVVAPPVDVLSGVLPLLPSEGNLQIFADWDQYSEMPRANGVFYRPGWMYYPWVCDVSGEVGWSPRVGESSYSFLGEDAICHPNRASASANVDVPVPPDAEQVRFVYEIWASCDQFGLPEEDCSGETNETPLIDNIRVRFTVVPNAPIVNFDTGTNFQDGFAHGTNVNDPTKPGRADVARNLSFGNAPPYVLGDSLAIRGPAPTGANTRWEARLWYRVSRVGPGANANYVAWRDRVADGKAMDPELAGSGNPIEFTFGFMDSTQVGTSAFRNRFCSYFREDDDDFDVGSPELSDGNEMIADDVLFPGTRIEYFISANYLVEPSQYFLLPDTSGGYFDEFEILPSWRDDEGVWKYPCFLQIDAYNQVTDEFMAEALALAGIESDRFDHRDACACWAAPMNRGLDPANTNGMTLPQLLGYRGVLVNVGLRGEFWPEDYQLFGDYLTAGICGTDRRGFILNGTRSTDPYWENAFVEQRLGVGLVDDDYRGFSGDENYCVQIAEPAGGGVAYGTSHSGGNYSYSAFGSGCPDPHGYDVFVPLGTAIGNRVYVNETNGAETGFAQIVNEGTSPHNYRSVVDATSWPYLAGQGATGECLIDRASRVEAISNEVRAAVEWIYGAADLPTLCEDPCGDEVTQVDPDGLVAPVATRLEVGAPNPFSPQTTLRYTLGAQGPVDLAIFDVGGRRVRTLASGERTAGSHEVVWDGLDDSGGRVASGTYWARLQAAGRRSASRLVVLR